MTGPNAVSETLYTSLTDQLPSFLSSALLSVSGCLLYRRSP